MTLSRTDEMLKNIFLFAVVFGMTVLGFHGGASASSSYLCRAENVGSADEINIEFPYQEDDQAAVQNLYISITKVRGGETRLWDALYSSDGDYNYWTTPVLRDVNVGTSALLISQENGRNPGQERLVANFSGENYPVQCVLK
jgi:hypothetical protein